MSHLFGIASGKLINLQMVIFNTEGVVCFFGKVKRFRVSHVLHLVLFLGFFRVLWFHLTSNKSSAFVFDEQISILVNTIEEQHVVTGIIFFTFSQFDRSYDVLFDGPSAEISCPSSQMTANHVNDNWSGTNMQLCQSTDQETAVCVWLCDCLI